MQGAVDWPNSADLQRYPYFYNLIEMGITRENTTANAKKRLAIGLP
jgi:hypothetical protein